MLNEVIVVSTKLCLICADVCASLRLVLFVGRSPTIANLVRTVYIAGWLGSGYEAGIAHYQRPLIRARESHNADLNILSAIGDFACVKNGVTRRNRVNVVSAVSLYYTDIASSLRL